MTEKSVTITGDKLAPMLRRVHHQFCQDIYCHFEKARHEMRVEPEHLFRMHEQWFSRMCSVAYDFHLANLLMKLQSLLSNNGQAIALIRELCTANQKELKQLADSIREMPKDDDLLNGDMRRHLLITAGTADPADKIALRVRSCIGVVNHGLDSQVEQMPPILQQVYRNTPDVAKNTRLYRVAFRSHWTLFGQEIAAGNEAAWRDIIARHWHAWLEYWKKSLHDSDKCVTQFIQRL